MPFIFKWECVRDKSGNVISENDPSDPGGLTKFGIDQRSHPGTNIRALTEKQALDIYRREYWDRNRIDSMPEPLGEVYFNACVNCGAGRAKKLLALSGTNASQFLSAQEGFYHRLAASNPKLKKFLKGWLNRTQDLRKFIKV
jgi:hypothetical protein